MEEPARERGQERVREVGTRDEDRITDRGSRWLLEDKALFLGVEAIEDYAIFLLDPTGRVATWNRGAERIKGYTAEEIIGRPFSCFYPEEDRRAGKCDRALELAGRTGKFQDEGWRIRKDGTRFWASVVLTAVRDEGGRLCGFVKVTRDLTERKRAEENALQLAEERTARAASEGSLKAISFLAQASQTLSSTLDYERTLQAVARLVVPTLGDNCVVDVVETDGSIRRVAGAAADPEKEPLLRRLRQFPPDAARKTPITEVLRTGQTVFIPHFDVTSVGSLTAGDEHGEIVGQIAPRSSVTVPLIARGKVLGAMTFGMAESGRGYTQADVQLAEELGRRAGVAVENARLFQAQARASAEARTHRTQLEATFQSMNDGVMAFDMAGAVVLVNEAEARICGYSSAAEMKRDLEYFAQVFELAHPDGRSLPVEEWPVSRVMRGETFSDWELRGRRRDTGREWFFSFSGAPVLDDAGRQALAMVITRDITERRRTEQALRDSQQLLRTMMDNFPTVLAFKDREGRFLDVNGAVEKALGLPKERILGRTMYDFVPKEAADVLHRHEEEVMKSRQARQQEEVTPLPSGTLYHLNTSFPLIDSEGRVYGTGHISQDITEVKRAAKALQEGEERLRTSERKFSLLFQKAPFATALIKMSSGTFVDVNEAWVKLFGVSRDEAVGRNSLQLELYQDPEERRRVYEELKLKGAVSGYEGQVVSRSGARRTVLSNMDIIELDGERYMLGVLEDVTERKRAERALIDSERHFRFLADNLPLIIWTAAPDGRVDYYNRRWGELAGPERAEDGIESWTSLLHPDDLQAALGGWRHSVETGQPYQMEYRLLASAMGGYRWFLGHGVPLKDERGRVTRWFGTIIDIQEQKEHTEKLAEALRIREDFLAIAGHELKTPLAALLMHVHSLERAQGAGVPVAKLQERLQKASAAGLRLENLINQMLDVSRITAGRLHLEREHFELEGLVREVVDRFAELAQRAGSKLALRSEACARGFWDRSRLDQVLSNLLSNAVKYGKGKPVDVELREEDGQAVVRVTDRGIGIDRSQQERIFERFERAVGTREFGGFGLGLWISRQITQASGGSIEVASQPGQGATFTLRLPLRPPEGTR